MTDSEAEPQDWTPPVPGFVSVRTIRAKLHDLVLREFSDVLVIDLARRKIMVEGLAQSLTYAEANVLEALMAAHGEILTRADLVASVETQPRVQKRAVDTIVGQLRAKLGVHESVIKSHYRVGYSLNLTPAVTVRTF